MTSSLLNPLYRELEESQQARPHGQSQYSRSRSKLYGHAGCVRMVALDYKFLEQFCVRVYL